MFIDASFCLVYCPDIIREEVTAPCITLHDECFETREELLQKLLLVVLFEQGISGCKYLVECSYVLGEFLCGRGILLSQKIECLPEFQTTFLKIQYRMAGVGFTGEIVVQLVLEIDIAVLLQLIECRDPVKLFCVDLLDFTFDVVESKMDQSAQKEHPHRSDQ